MLRQAPERAPVGYGELPGLSWGDGSYHLRSSARLQNHLRFDRIMYHGTSRVLVSLNPSSNATM